MSDRLRQRANTPASRGLTAVVSGVTAAVPVVLLPELSFHFDVAPKIVLLLLGTAAAILLWPGYVEGLTRAVRGRASRWFLLLLGLSAASLVVSTVLSSQPELSFAGTNWRRLGLVSHAALLSFAAVFLGWALADIERVRTPLRAITGAGLLVSCYGIVQYFGIDPLLPAEAYHVGGEGWGIVRPPGTLGHAGYFATYLLYVVFLAAALVRLEESAVWRRLAGATVLVAAIAIVLTGTRSALLGLAGGAALALIWYRPRVTRRRAIGVAALAAGAVAFLLLPAGQKLRSRVQWSVEDARGGSRLWLWRDSLRMGGDHWLLGTGLETFGNEFPRHQSVDLARAYPDWYHESPHNVFLDTLTAQGVLGLAAFAGLAVLPLWAAWRNRKQAPDVTGLAAAAVVGGLINQQFLAFTVPTALYLYVAAAWLMALSSSPVPGSRKTPGEAPRQAPAWRWATIPPAVGFACFAVQLGLADLHLARVRSLVRVRDVAGGMEAYKEVRRAQPWGMSVDFWYSRAMASLAGGASSLEDKQSAWREGLAAAGRAVGASEQKLNAYYNLAAFRSVVNDFTGTETALRASIEIAPAWYKSHWMLARILEKAGRTGEARQEAERAVELNGGKSAEVTATWEELRSRTSPPEKVEAPYEPQP